MKHHVGPPLEVVDVNICAVKVTKLTFTVHLQNKIRLLLLEATAFILSAFARFILSI
jgi:hypothetical protein